MSTMLNDDALVDDMARALRLLRGWLMEIAEQHPEMDTSIIDVLLRRYDDEVGAGA